MKKTAILTVRLEGKDVSDYEGCRVVGNVYQLHPFYNKRSTEQSLVNQYKKYYFKGKDIKIIEVISLEK